MTGGAQVARAGPSGRSARARPRGRQSSASEPVLTKFAKGKKYAKGRHLDLGAELLGVGRIASATEYTL